MKMKSFHFISTWYAQSPLDNVEALLACICSQWSTDDNVDHTDESFRGMKS